LEAALKKTIRRRPDISLTRLENARPADGYGHLAGQGYPLVIVLRITDSYVGTHGAAFPDSRVHVAVKGEVVDTATNERKVVKHWTHTGESVEPSRLAENQSELLKSQMKQAWAEISAKIAEDVFP
jgi:hypothetical protein